MRVNKRAFACESSQLLFGDFRSNENKSCMSVECAITLINSHQNLIQLLMVKCERQLQLSSTLISFDLSLTLQDHEISLFFRLTYNNICLESYITLLSVYGQAVLNVGVQNSNVYVNSGMVDYHCMQTIGHLPFPPKTCNSSCSKTYMRNVLI